VENHPLTRLDEVAAVLKSRGNHRTNLWNIAALFCR